MKETLLTMYNLPPGLVKLLQTFNRISKYLNLSRTLSFSWQNLILGSFPRVVFLVKILTLAPTYTWCVYLYVCLRGLVSSWQISKGLRSKFLYFLFYISANHSSAWGRYIGELEMDRKTELEAKTCIPKKLNQQLLNLGLQCSEISPVILKDAVAF